MNFLQDPKAALTVAITMMWTGVTKFWEWLPGNLGTITGVIGIVIGVITIRNQLQVYNRTKLEQEKTRLEIEELKSHAK
jgi:uncharacterized membrane-anchored protein YhcB (DUF1043 family)